MESISESILSLTNSSNPMVYYIVGGVMALFAIMFIRKVLYMLSIVVVLTVALYGWSYYTGNPLPFEVPASLNPENIISTLKGVLNQILGLMPISADQVVDGATSGTGATPE